MCHTSVRSHVIILVTWILTDTRKSKNIPKKIKFGWKIRIQLRPDNQDSWKKEMCTNEKAGQTACTCTACGKVIRRSHNPGFIR